MSSGNLSVIGDLDSR